MVAVRGSVIAARPSSSCSCRRCERVNDVYSMRADASVIPYSNALACLLSSTLSACVGSDLAASFDIRPRLPDRAGRAKLGGVPIASVTRLRAPFASSRANVGSSSHPTPEYKASIPVKHLVYTLIATSSCGAIPDDAGQEVGLDASRPISPSPAPWRGNAACCEVIQHAA